MHIAVSQSVSQSHRRFPRPPGWLATKKPSAPRGTRQKRACELGRCSPDRRLTFSPGRRCAPFARAPAAPGPTRIGPRVRRWCHSPRRRSVEARGWKTATSARRQSAACMIARHGRARRSGTSEVPLCARSPDILGMAWRWVATAFSRPLDMAATARWGARLSDQPLPHSQAADPKPLEKRQRLRRPISECVKPHVLRSRRSLGPLASCTTRARVVLTAHAAAHRLRLWQASTTDPSTASGPFSEALEVRLLLPPRLASLRPPSACLARERALSWRAMVLGTAAAVSRVSRGRVRRWAERGQLEPFPRYSP